MSDSSYRSLLLREAAFLGGFFFTSFQTAAKARNKRYSADHLKGGARSSAELATLTQSNPDARGAR